MTTAKHHRSIARPHKRRGPIMHLVLLATAFTILPNTFSAITVAPATAQETAPPAAQAELDNLYQRTQAFLSRAVTADGLVDYEWAKSQIARLDLMVDGYAQPHRFRATHQRLAYYINAYNLIVIQQVIAHDSDTLHSVLDVDGFFDKTVHRVDGRSVTLNEIEKRLLQPIGDPRTHAALVCAATSCPPLAPTAYTPEKIDDQLDHVTRRWINDTTKNTATADAFKLSKIFEWYPDDFKAPPYDSIIGFLRAHVDPANPIAQLLEQNPTAPIEYLEYDWTLNAALPQ